MATSKTLNPTNVSISIPALGDVPDASVFSNCIDKEADAINALNSQLSNTNANDCATVVNSGDAFAARKVGNMLIIDFMGANRTHTEDELLFTLSSGYRPVARTKAVGSISTTPVVIDIAEDGKCTIYLINGATSSARLYFHIVIAI